MATDTLKLVYSSCFHCILSYALIFWGNSTDRTKVFNTQKKVITIRPGAKSKVSCRKLFWKCNIFQLASEYIFCLLSFVVGNFKKFQRNTDVHNLNTRHKYNFHIANANLAKYLREVYYTGIKLFSNLPPTIESLNHNINVFKSALKDYLLTYPYSVDDFTPNEIF
jgi:hypothetical protein